MEKGKTDFNALIVAELRGEDVRPDQFAERYRALFFLFNRRHFDATDVDDQLQWEQAFRMLWDSDSGK